MRKKYIPDVDIAEPLGIKENGGFIFYSEFIGFLKIDFHFDNRRFYKHNIGFSFHRLLHNHSSFQSLLSPVL